MHIQCIILSEEKEFVWNKEKNRVLKKGRGISFKKLIDSMDNGGLLDIIDNKNQEKYPGQRFFIVDFKNYAYYLPFVESERQIFLKTAFPNRKANQKYLKQQ